METRIVTLGGAAIAVARHQRPDWSFAALVSNGGAVVAHVFEGRILKSTVTLKSGADPEADFAALTKLTAKKAGLFKRTPFRAACVAVRRRGQKASLRLDFERDDAFTPAGDNPRTAFHRVIGDAFPDEAGAMFRDGPRPTVPRALVEGFIRDYRIWNDYAWAEREIDDPEAGWNQRQSYDNLIMRYCGPDKNYQGLAFGSESDHCPAQETITAVEESGGQAEVRTRFQNAEFDFLGHDYAYELARGETGWRLKELWLCDQDGRHPCL